VNRAVAEARLHALRYTPFTFMEGGYRARLEKDAGDGKPVILAQNSNGGWFVGHPGDPAFDPFPLGEFPSEEAARSYADARFPGGAWHPAPKHQYYP
jgi:hypothetical protein